MSIQSFLSTSPSLPLFLLFQLFLFFFFHQKVIWITLRRQNVYSIEERQPKKNLNNLTIDDCIQHLKGKSQAAANQLMNNQLIYQLAAQHKILLSLITAIFIEKAFSSTFLPNVTFGKFLSSSHRIAIMNMNIEYRNYLNLLIGKL